VTTRDERARQAEMDAARAREIEEERLSYQERVSSAGFPDIDAAVAKQLTTKVIRNYVNNYMARSVLGRLFDIGHGVTTFEVPTMMGNTVVVPAPASVQVRALSRIADIFAPKGLQLVDDDGNVVPGVFALGPLELDQARAAVHGDRYIRQLATVGGQSEGTPGPLRPMEERIAAGEFTVVEVDEAAELVAASDDVAPPPLTEPETPEQAALARHRARHRRT
jgi:hypothetical protein